MQLFCLVFVLTVAVARSEILDINNDIDLTFRGYNYNIRNKGLAIVKITGGVFQNASYSEGELVGMDSVRRTGNCTLNDTKDGSLSFDLHYGLGMWVQTMKSLKIGSDEMSAAFRIRNNSYHLAFTIHNSTTSKCHVSLEDLRVERLANVEFSSSLPEYDGINVEHSFQVYAEAINDFFKAHRKMYVEGMQFLCNLFPHEHLQHLPAIMTQSLRTL